MDISEFLGHSSSEATHPRPAALSAGWGIPQVDHLSATSVSMFMRCPEQWRNRYILGLKERPGAALVVGSSFHIAQETNFRQKIESFEDLPVDQVSEAFHAAWDSELAKYGGVNEIEWDASEKPDTLRAKGEKLAVAYRTIVSPSLQPEAVEHRFETNIDGAGVPFVGSIDFIGTREHGQPFNDDYSSEDIVVDYKTAKAIKRELKPEWMLQARLYQMETGRRVEYHVAAKTKDPKIATPVDAPQFAIEPSETKTAVTARLLARVTQQIKMFYTTFGPDTAWPGAITHPWACSFCGYRPHCAWQQG